MVLFPTILFFSLLIGNSFGHSRHDWILGECPRGWDEAGYLCYKYDHDHEGFFSALRACKDKEDHHADIDQDFNEDESLLLTVGKVMEFHRDGHSISDYFHHTVRINAVAVNGRWWEIQNVPSSHIDLEDIPSMTGRVQEITMKDFKLLKIGNLYNQSQDGNGLIFNPDEGIGTFKVANIDHDFPYICTHKREKRQGVTCQGEVAECNDRGTCFNGQCECWDGYHQDFNCAVFPCTPSGCDGGDSCCTSSNQCCEGEGDCDNDSHCVDGLVCGTNNCVGSTFGPSDDCCYYPG